ncbi:MAG: hypothetical protein ACXWCZ_07050 [Flavisolibacter sp.]
MTDSVDFCIFSEVGAESYISRLHSSTDFAPQMLQEPASLNMGLLLLQVPANLPSFFTRILIAIPAKASPTSTMEINTTAMFKFKQFQMKALAEP